MVLAFSIFAPNAQLVVGSIVFVDPAVLVRVKCGEFEKSIAALRPEQFRSVVDFAIAVSVECEETAVARQEIYLFRLTVGIEVEFEALAAEPLKLRTSGSSFFRASPARILISDSSW